MTDDRTSTIWATSEPWISSMTLRCQRGIRRLASMAIPTRNGSPGAWGRENSLAQASTGQRVAVVTHMWPALSAIPRNSGFSPSSASVRSLVPPSNGKAATRLAHGAPPVEHIGDQSWDRVTTVSLAIRGTAEANPTVRQRERRRCANARMTCPPSRGQSIREPGRRCPSECVALADVGTTRRSWTRDAR